MEIKEIENTEQLTKLEKSFPDFKINTYKCLNKTKSVFNIFCLTTEKQNLLLAEWENIVSNVAGNFQIDFETEFEKWNLYIMFFVKEKCSKALKYKIENDKFSSRKIVIDNFTGIENDYSKIIKSRIFNLDLSISLDIKTKKNTFIEKPLSKKLITILNKYELKQGTGYNKKQREKALNEMLKQY